MFHDEIFALILKFTIWNNDAYKGRKFLGGLVGWLVQQLGDSRSHLNKARENTMNSEDRS